MSRDEDLYADLQRQEEEEDYRYQQRRAELDSHKKPRREPNETAALARYNREIRPVLEARQRVIEGRAPTGNPVRNAWLRLTGRDKIPDVPKKDIADPTKGFVLSGPTIQEVQKEIAANPAAHRHLARKAPEVRRVEAKRRGAGDLHK